jgi:hypothetical protein
MTKKREKLLDLVIAKFGHEHPTTIKMADIIERSVQTPLADSLLEKLVSIVIK